MGRTKKWFSIGIPEDCFLLWAEIRRHDVIQRNRRTHSQLLKDILDIYAFQNGIEIPHNQHLKTDQKEKVAETPSGKDASASD